MKLLVINSVAGIKSTGRIAADILKQYEAQGYECKIAYGRDNVPEELSRYAIRIENRVGILLHAAQTRLFDRHGLGSVHATKAFLKWADCYDPDVLWMHNLHGYYLNYELLFQWIKTRPEMTVYWTLHDCWSFTGHCAHFEDIGCERWKTGCVRCPKKKEYPGSLIFDNSRSNYTRKKAAFRDVRGMTVITPSKWLAGLVKESFLSDYKVEVRRNRVDLDGFRPVSSDFRNRHDLLGKYVILGVASSWSAAKGLDDFLRLRRLLPDEYVIVMVGLNQRQLKELPEGIVGMGMTHSKQELAEIYSAADVFWNPTYADTYPTVNLEAQACGTPVITYKTGGSPESVPEENVVEAGDLDGVIRLIRAGVLRVLPTERLSE